MYRVNLNLCILHALESFSVRDLYQQIVYKIQTMYSYLLLFSCRKHTDTTMVNKEKTNTRTIVQKTPHRKLILSNTTPILGHPAEVA